MKWHILIGVLTVLALPSMGLPSHVIAQHAVEVVSYDAGTNPAREWGTNLYYNIEAAALGEPERFTGDGGVYPSVVSPFSGPFLREEIVSIGEGGHLTLRLSNYVMPQAIGAEIGVFANVNLDDSAWPSGVARSPAVGFGIDSAAVEVSPDGLSWISLGNVLFDVPTNGYVDLPDPYSATSGSVLADFQQPFTGTLGSFDGLSHFDPAATDILDVLAGSGGGTWLDISGAGLANIGYIRFGVADDGDTGTSLSFELDAVSIAHGAAGALTVPEPAAWLLSAVLVCLVAAAVRIGT